MPTPVPQNRVRVAGAGFTLLMWNSQPVAFCEQIAHTSPRPIAPPSFIQPMDEPYVVETLLAPAAGPGTMVLNLYELFGSGGVASKVWDRLGANVGKGLTQPFGNHTGGGGANGQFNTSTFLNSLTPGAGAFAGAVDIVDLFLIQAQLTPDQMSVSKIIRPLNASGTEDKAYTEDYVGCMITDVVDGETVAVGTKEIIKQLTVTYRYLLRDGQTSQAFALRGGHLGTFTAGAI